MINVERILLIFIYYYILFISNHITSEYMIRPASKCELISHLLFHLGSLQAIGYAAEIIRFAVGSFLNLNQIQSSSFASSLVRSFAHSFDCSMGSSEWNRIEFIAHEE